MPYTALSRIMASAALPPGLTVVKMYDAKRVSLCTVNRKRQTSSSVCKIALPEIVDDFNFGEHVQGRDCEGWVERQAEHPNPVLHLDFSCCNANKDAAALHGWLNRKLENFAEDYDLVFEALESGEETLEKILRLVFKKGDEVVAL